MSLLRACCRQPTARPGRHRAGHAWLSSTSCPHSDVLFSWQHLLLLRGASHGGCCFSQRRRCRAFLLPSPEPCISQLTLPARHTMKLNSNLLQYPENIELLISVQTCEFESSRCQGSFYHLDFKAGLISSTQDPRQLCLLSSVLKLRTK